MLYDGGLFGVVIITSTIGFIYSLSLYSFFKFRTIKTLSLFILVFICLFFSILKNQFGQQYLVIGMLFFIFAPKNIYLEKIKL